MKNEENKNERFEKSKEAWGDIWKKTKEVSKKTAQKAQEEAKKIAEQMEQKKQEREQEKYNPLSEKEFRSKKYSVPTVIKIVDDAAIRQIEVCEDAIGWRQVYNGVEVLYLNYKIAIKCDLTFVPVARINEVYCVDNFDKTKYVNVNYMFEKITDEKMAELEHIAYCLGAKSCSIEMVESDVNSKSSTRRVELGIPAGETKSAIGEAKALSNKQSGKTVTRFEGTREPTQPTLKWFVYDAGINNLIKMKLLDNRSIKSKLLELNGSAQTAISKETAIAIDNALGKALKGGFSAESQVSKEQSRVLIFEVEF